MQPETDLPSACPALEALEPRLLLAQNLMVIVPAEFVPGEPLPVVLACNEISPGPFMNYAIVAIGPEGNRKIVDLFDSSGTERLSETADRSIEFDDYDPDTQTQYEYLQVCMTANWWYTVGYIRPSDYNDPACFDGSTLPIRVGFDYKNAVGVPYFQLVEAATKFIPALPTWSGSGWGWYAGDTHFHTDFTDNGAEFGDPLLVDSLIGGEKNLGWFAYTDHSYELDNLLSINPELPPFGDPDVLMSLADYRDAPETNSWGDSPGNPYSHGAAWHALPIKGEEMSVDGWHVPGEAVFRQHHLLVYGFGPEDTVIRSTESDNFDDDNGPTDLRDMNTILDELAARSGPDYPTFGYAAHPATTPEWTQIIDYTWSQPWTADIATDAYNYGLANGQHLLRGFEFWNSENDKISESGALHSGRDASLEMWEEVLANLMDPADGTGVPHHWYLVGGSDSHGARRIGEVRTVLCAPDDGAGDILDALYYGRGIVTDGPYFAMGLDLNGDGDIMDFGVDTMMGEQAVLAGPNQAELHFDWPNQSATAWGDVPMEDILVYHYDSNGAADPNGPYDDTSGYYDLAQNTFDLYQLWLDQGSPAGWQCFRAELFMSDLTDPGRSYKAYTNPIWVYFLPPPEVSVAATDPSASEIGPDPGTFTISRTGPTNTALEVQFTISGSTADSGADYADLGDYAIIPIGASSVTLTVNPVVDYENEPTERINLTLTPLTLYTFGPGRSDYVSIANAAPPDLAVTKFIVSPAHAALSSGTTAHIKVENLGDLPAPGQYEVEVRLSDDSVIDASDRLLQKLYFSSGMAPHQVFEDVDLPLNLPAQDPFLTDNEYWVGTIVVPKAGAFDLTAANNSNVGHEVDKDAISSEKHLHSPLDGTVEVDLIAGGLPFTATQTIQAALGDEWVEDRDIDTYRFHAAAGQRLGFDIDVPSGLDSYIRVFDSSWNLLAGNSYGAAPDDSAPYECYLQHTFATAGDYYVVVGSGNNEGTDPRTWSGRQWGCTGPYTLVVTNILQPDLMATVMTASPDRVPSDGRTGVDITLRNDGTADAGGFSVQVWMDDTRVINLNPAFRQGQLVGAAWVAGLAKNTNTTIHLDLNLPCPAPLNHSNRYWLCALVDADGQVTEYNEINNANRAEHADSDAVSAEDHVPCPADGVHVRADPIAPGQTISAVIGDEWIGAEDLDTYVFTPAAGQTLGFDVDATGGTLDPYLWLFDKDFHMLDRNDQEAAPGETVADAYLERTFPDAGPYYLCVAARGSSALTPWDTDPRQLSLRSYLDAGTLDYTLQVTALPGLSSLGPRVVTARCLYDSTLEIIFNEPVSRWSFTAQDVSVTGPSGALPAASMVSSPEMAQSPTAMGYRVWWVAWMHVNPDNSVTWPPLPAGTYTVTVGPNVTDMAGNSMDQDGDRVGSGPTDNGDIYQGSFEVGVPSTTPQVSIAATDNTAAESASPVNKGAFTVTRTGATTHPLTVLLGVSGTAALGTDYTLTLGATATALTSSVTIPAGQASAIVTVHPINDTAIEGPEGIILTLVTDAAYTFDWSHSSATVTLLDNDLPTLTILGADPVAAETTASDTANPGVFRISRTGGMAAPLTVSFKRSGTATSGADYTLSVDSTTLTGNVVTIPAGQSYVDVTLNPVDDSLPEPTETAILTLVANTAYTLDPTAAARTATVSILDNEAVVSIAATDTQAAETRAAEAADTGTFCISRTGLTDNPLTVQFRRSGTATSGVDYLLKLGDTTIVGNSVTIPAHQASVDITVCPNDDARVEAAESVVLTLLAQPTCNLDSVPGNRAATVSILDNEPVLSISPSDATAPESGTPPTNTGAFTISRTGTIGALTVNFTRSGTATFGATRDYTLFANGVNLTGMSVVIPNGQDHVDIAVNPVDDLLAEPTQTVILTLKTNTAYALTSTPSARTATVSILDNEPTVGIEAIDASASEPGSDTGLFRFSRTGPTGSPLTVDFTRTGTATAGSDFISFGNSITIPAGASSVDLELFPLADLLAEASETVKLTLRTATSYSVDATKGFATVAIASSNTPLAGQDVLILSMTYAARTFSLSTPGQTWPVSTAVRNQGTTAAGPFSLELRLSADRIWGNADDVVIHSWDILGLGARQTLPLSNTVHLDTVAQPPAPGSYYVLVKIDAVDAISEAIESNNVYASLLSNIKVTA